MLGQILDLARDGWFYDFSAKQLAIKVHMNFLQKAKNKNWISPEWLNNSDHKSRCGRRAGGRTKCWTANGTRSRGRLDNDGPWATADGVNDPDAQPRRTCESWWRWWLDEPSSVEDSKYTAALPRSVLGYWRLRRWPHGPDAHSRPASRSCSTLARSVSALRYASDECFFSFLYIKYVYIYTCLLARIAGVAPPL